MSEWNTPTERLAEIGVSIPEYVPDGTTLSPYVLIGSRLLVTAQPPYAVDGFSVPRLNLDANTDADDSLGDLADDHPLRLALVGARLASIRVLSVAQAAVGGDLGAISGCVRAVLNLRTGPNFERLGMVFMPVNRIMSTAFGTGPAHSIAGVAALPGGASMTLETEFRLHRNV